jgi:hypothetical protein
MASRGGRAALSNGLEDADCISGCHLTASTGHEAEGTGQETVLNSETRHEGGKGAGESGPASTCMHGESQKRRVLPAHSHKATSTCGVPVGQSQPQHPKATDAPRAYLLVATMLASLSSCRYPSACSPSTLLPGLMLL